MSNIDLGFNLHIFNVYNGGFFNQKTPPCTVADASKLATFLLHTGLVSREVSVTFLAGYVAGAWKAFFEYVQMPMFEKTKGEHVVYMTAFPAAMSGTNLEVDAAMTLVNVVNAMLKNKHLRDKKDWPHTEFDNTGDSFRKLTQEYCPGMPVAFRTQILDIVSQPLNYMFLDILNHPDRVWAGSTITLSDGTSILMVFSKDDITA